jgi:hypothetical protein
MGEFMCKYTNWEKLKYDIDEVVIPYLRVNGATKFGTVGTCWGGYNIIKLSEYSQCLFAIGFHASHFPMMKFTTGEDYIAAFQAVTNDVFLANSIGEPEENSQGGLLDQIMGDKHEFYARGNLCRLDQSRLIIKIMIKIMDLSLEVIYPIPTSKLMSMMH